MSIDGVGGCDGGNGVGLMVMDDNLIRHEISDAACMSGTLLALLRAPQDGDHENRRPKSILVVCLARVLFDHPRRVAGVVPPRYCNLCYLM